MIDTRYSRNISAVVRHEVRSDVRKAREQYDATLRMRREIEAKSHLFPDLTDLSDYVFIYSNLGTWSNIDINIPWDDDLFNQICERILEKGWVYDHENDMIERWKSHTVIYTHPEFEMSLELRIVRNADRSGSTCKLVVDRTEMVEKAYYRLECEEE